jgi:hypothetical protein
MHAKDMNELVDLRYADIASATYHREQCVHVNKIAASEARHLTE